MLESKQASADQGPPEFVSEIACAIGRFDQNFCRRLVKPLSCLQFFFPGPSATESGVGSNINRRPGQGQRTFAAGEPVSYFSTRTGCCAIERLYRGGKIMRLCFQRDDRVKIFYFEKIRYILAARSKLFYARPFNECDVVLVSRDKEVRILFRCFLNE